MNVPLEIILIPLFLFGSWFFSGIETGIISINRHRLLHLVRGGSRRAKLIEGYLLDDQRLYGTLLVGNNLSNVILSTVCGSLSGRAWGPLGQSITSVVLALVILILCEYFPKIWFNSRPIQRSLRFAPLFRFMETLLRPLSFLAISLTRLLVAQGKSRNLFVTRDHIQTLARSSEAGGEITAFERLVINQVFALQLKTAEQLMTPINQVVTIAPDDTLAACFERVRESGHLRLPVIDPVTQTCSGVLDTFEVLTCEAFNPDAPAHKHMRAPLFLRSDLQADDILPVLRRHRQTMAIIRTPKSEIVRGIVTQENILSTLISGALPATAKTSVPAKA